MFEINAVLFGIPEYMASFLAMLLLQVCCSLDSVIRTRGLDINIIISVLFNRQASISLYYDTL